MSAVLIQYISQDFITYHLLSVVHIQLGDPLLFSYSINRFHVFRDSLSSLTSYRILSDPLCASISQGLWADIQVGACLMVAYFQDL